MMTNDETMKHDGPAAAWITARERSEMFYPPAEDTDRDSGKITTTAARHRMNMRTAIESAEAARDAAWEAKLVNEQTVRAFFNGYRSAVRFYAVWHDGRQLVGVTRKPLADVLERLYELEGMAVCGGLIPPEMFA